MRNFYASNGASCIPYRKEYRKHFIPFFSAEEQTVKGLTMGGAIVFQQLEYWSAKKPKGFYKFLAKPANSHPKYNDGDSWVEELGCSEKEFRTCFEQVGASYKSKKEFMEQPDPFQGKFYCSYVDRINHLTWYFRNHQIVDSFLDRVASSPVDEPPKGDYELPDVTPNCPVGVCGDADQEFAGVPTGSLHKLPVGSSPPAESEVRYLYTEITSETTTQDKKEASTSEASEEGASQKESSQDGYPKGSEEPDQGSAKSKSLRVRPRVTKENPYGLEDPKGFENFWAWYGERMCPPGNSAIGSKADAAKEWGQLEDSNFLRQGREGFREGCKIALSEVVAKGSKVKHAKGFLRGDRTGGKQSPPIWLEKITVVDTGSADAFLGSDVETSTSTANPQSLDKSIRTELERLGMYGVLPPEWKLKTGKNKPSELTDTQKTEYLGYLRSLESKTEAA